MVIIWKGSKNIYKITFYSDIKKRGYYLKPFSSISQRLDLFSINKVACTALMCYKNYSPLTCVRFAIILISSLSFICERIVQVATHVALLFLGCWLGIKFHMISRLIGSHSSYWWTNKNFTTINLIKMSSKGHL